ncbi:hypothetical protein PCE1_001656 [Barthelona sp. PCE]
MNLTPEQITMLASARSMLTKLNHKCKNYHFDIEENLASLQKLERLTNKAHSEHETFTQEIETLRGAINHIDLVTQNLSREIDHRAFDLANKAAIYKRDDGKLRKRRRKASKHSDTAELQELNKVKSELTECNVYIRAEERGIRILNKEIVKNQRRLNSIIEDNKFRNLQTKLSVDNLRKVLHST